MSEVITIGEPMVMFLADSKKALSKEKHFTKYIAGAELNVAMGIRRLNHTVSYVTQVGDDPFGVYVKNFLETEKIDTSYIKTTNEAPTGFQMKNQCDDGDSQVVYFRKGSAASRMNKKLLNNFDFKDAKVLHLTGIFPALSKDTREMVFQLIEKAREHGLMITFDPNPRPVLWESEEEMIRVTNEIACKCDVVMPGLSEGKLFTGRELKEEIADYYLTRGAKTVILKTGPTGSYMKERMKDGTLKECQVPSFQVPVVDTVGAGDGFAAGIISAVLEGMGKEKVLERGNALGAIQVMHLSDNEGLPDPEQLAGFFAHYKRQGEVAE